MELKDAVHAARGSAQWTASWWLLDALERTAKAFERVCAGRPTAEDWDLLKELREAGVLGEQWDVGRMDGEWVVFRDNLAFGRFLSESDARECLEAMQEYEREKQAT